MVVFSIFVYFQVDFFQQLKLSDDKLEELYDELKFHDRKLRNQKILLERGGDRYGDRQRQLDDAFYRKFALRKPLDGFQTFKRYISLFSDITQNFGLQRDAEENNEMYNFRVSYLFVLLLWSNKLCAYRRALQ